MRDAIHTVQDLHLQARLKRVFERQMAGEQRVQHDAESPYILAGMRKGELGGLGEEQFGSCIREGSRLVDMRLGLGVVGGAPPRAVVSGNGIEARGDDFTWAFGKG